MYIWKVIDSPVGELKLVASGPQLAAILWKVEKRGRVVLGDMSENADHPVLREAERQLTEYFAGQRKVFQLDLRLQGTPFQQSVWHALLAIPYGEMRTYSDIAEQLGIKNGARAVGAANGRNPIAIITPCHRLVGASGGGLRGFAGGLDAKQTLLSLESEVFRTRKTTGERVFVPASGYTPASWIVR